MSLPDHVIGTIAAMRDPQLFERIGMAILLQMIYDPAARYAFDKPQDIFRVDLAVCNQVNVIQHDDIGKDEELA